MSESAITRVAQFMSMCIAHRMCVEGVEDRSELKRDDVAFHFMGSGASDMLTVGDILDFEKAATDMAELATLREAATTIQGRNEDMLTRALGGIAKLSSIVQQIKTPEIAPAFEVPPGLDIIQEVVRGAWHAMDNAEELGTGDLMVDRQYAADLNKALDDMQDAVVETETEVGDAPHFVTQWRQQVEAIFLAYGWRTPEEGEPQTMPQMTGWYLVECEYQPVDGDIGYDGSGPKQWHELVYITVSTDAFDNPVELDVNREDKWKFSHQLGEMFWEDVLRYAMIPCMPYHKPTADSDTFDRQIDLFGGDHTD